MIEISNNSLICGKPIIGILDIVNRVQDYGIRNVSVQFDKGEKVEDPFKDRTVIRREFTRPREKGNPSGTHERLAFSVAKVDRPADRPSSAAGGPGDAVKDFAVVVKGIACERHELVGDIDGYSSGLGDVLLCGGADDRRELADDAGWFWHSSVLW